MKRLNKKTKLFIIISSIFLFIGILGLIFGLVYNGLISKKLYVVEYVRNLDEYTPERTIPHKLEKSSNDSIEKEVIFTMPEGVEDFKILQLTDVHITAGKSTKNLDYKAIEAVDRVIKASKPDLIVLTGDSIYCKVSTNNLDNQTALNSVVFMMDHYKTPYMIIFGNHEEEAFNTTDSSWPIDISSYT